MGAAPGADARSTSSMIRILLRAAGFIGAIVVLFMVIGDVLTGLAGSPTRTAATGINVAAGESIFWNEGRCHTCHSIADRGDARRGPNLGEGDATIPRQILSSSPKRREGGSELPPIGARASVRAEEIRSTQGRDLTAAEYIMESMADPGAYVVEGFKNEMPPIWKAPIGLSPDQMQAVALYLLSLGGPADAAAPNVPDYVRSAASEPAAEWQPYVEGDPRRGEELFFDPSGPGCYKCHEIGDKGGNIGPALTDIGTIRTPQFILESILNPDLQIAFGFETVEIDTHTGERVRGVRKAEDANTVTLALASGEIQVVRKEEIRSIAPRKESTMPGNFGDLLTVNQLHDLLAYLIKQP